MHHDFNQKFTYEIIVLLLHHFCIVTSYFLFLIGTSNFGLTKNLRKRLEYNVFVI
jgi:hypothetical protein